MIVTEEFVAAGSYVGSYFALRSDTAIHFDTDFWFSLLNYFRLQYRDLCDKKSDGITLRITAKLNTIAILDSRSDKRFMWFFVDDLSVASLTQKNQIKEFFTEMDLDWEF